MPRLHGLELLHAWNIDFDYPRHLHEEHSIGVMLQGVEAIACRGTSHTAFPGNLLLINAEEAHSNRSFGTAYRVLKIKPAILNQIAFEIGGRKTEAFPFSKPVVEDATLFPHLLNLHLNLERNLPSLQLESEFISVMALFLERQMKMRSLPHRLAQGARSIHDVRDHLRSRYAQNISLAELSLLANLSPFHLLRVFRKQFGVAPHEYQTQVRIAHARRLIRNGRPIADAALETGFFDQSHLSRNFKRIVGMTPGQYSWQSKIMQDATEIDR